MANVMTKSYEIFAAYINCFPTKGVFGFIKTANANKAYGDIHTPFIDWIYFQSQDSNTNDIIQAGIPTGNDMQAGFWVENLNKKCCEKANERQE